MRKDEYLNCMEQELKQYDKTYVDEIIGDYDEHFREGIEQGKSEEDICAELGDVKELVKEIREMMGDEQQCEYEIARPVNTEVIKSETDFQEEETCRVDEGIAGLKKVNFSASSSDVCLIRSRDEKFHIYADDKDDEKNLIHQHRGDTYYGSIKSARKQGFLGMQILSMLSSGMGCVHKVILEVPDDLEEILIDSSSGDVTVNGIKCKELRVNSASGDLSIQNTGSKSIQLISKSGDVRFSQVSFGAIEIKNVSGDLNIKDITGKEFNANLVSGDIRGNSFKAEDIRVKAVSGDIRLNLECHGEPFYVYTKSISGDTRVNGGYQTAESELRSTDLKNRIKVTAITVSGDISVSGE